MYKTAAAYQGYPFLMLPDPYHPNSSVSPSVSPSLSSYARNPPPPPRWLFSRLSWPRTLQTETQTRVVGPVLVAAGGLFFIFGA